MKQWGIGLLIWGLAIPSTSAAIIKSGATSDQLTVDATSKAARVSLYGTDGRPLNTAATYSISSFHTPPATPNNLVIIEGSATKTIRVYEMWIYTQTTAAGSVQFFLKKYSTAATGGTFVSAGTPVPYDSTAAASTQNRVGHFTVDPTPGTLVGIIRAATIATPVLRPATPAGIIEMSGLNMICGSQMSLSHVQIEPITLNGTGQYLAIDFNDVALVAGQVHQYTIVWTEE